MCKYSSPPTKEAAKVNESSSEIGETGWHDPSQVLINFRFRLFFFFWYLSRFTRANPIMLKAVQKFGNRNENGKAMSILGKHILL